MNKLQKSFVAFLVLNCLMQLGVGTMMLVNFEGVVGSMFKINYTPDMAILGVPMGVTVFFTGVALALAILWTVQGEKKGISLGMMFGWLAVTAGIVAFAKLGTPDGLIVDVTRGVIILVLGVMAQGKEFSLHAKAA